ncbi:MAG: Gx transporter family protein [Clostridiales bacterium]|jgi:heptaprenyl diphosphate synthase|nr:Gx transporter family protein [Clostridiales bacterium]
MKEQSGVPATIKKTRLLALTAMLFAVSIVLAAVENSFPPPIAVPGIRFGLSNIAVMYALFFLGKRRAFMTAVLKALFVFCTRGAVAGAVSLCGGVLALAVMSLAVVLFQKKISYLMISVAGAVAHNLGQLAAVSLIYTSLSLWAYLPVLLIAGVAAGTVTASLLRLVLPVLRRLEP